MSRHFPLPHTGTPAVELLRAGDYALHAASDGSHALLWRGQTVNRWHAGTQPSGSDVLVHDLDSGQFLSTSGQRYGADARAATVTFEDGVARYQRQFEGLDTTLTVTLDPLHGGDLALLEIRNTGSVSRRLEAASVRELVLGDPRADATHPAYAKMFVVTEVISEGRVLLARRRPRANADATVWAAHGCRVDGASVSANGFETDRMRLLGRNRDLRDPASFDTTAITPGTSGVVLDPVFCLRRQFTLAAGQSVRVSFRTVCGERRQDVVTALAAALYADPAASLASVAAGVHVAPAPALASALLFNDNAWRAPAAVRLRAHGGQPALWPYAISGDRPIVQLKLASAAQGNLLDDLLTAQRGWQRCGLAVDLVVLASGEVAAIKAEVAARGPAANAGIAVFVVDDTHLDATAHDVIASAASIVIDGRDGDLDTQLALHAAPAPLALPAAPRMTLAPVTPPANGEAGFAANGVGHFSADGRAYVMDLAGTRTTPLPWVNVMANPDFGCIMSATGSGYAWAVNSQQSQITPWRNDPVTDRPSDAIYLHDAASGALWCPTPAPIRDGLPCRVTHGQGWTRFERRAHDLASELTVFVAPDDPVRVAQLRLTDTSGTARRIDVTAFAEWALEVIGRDGREHTVTWRDGESGALMARNRWRSDFAERTAFLAISGDTDTWTCDEAEVFGPRGDLATPAALTATPALQQRSGIGFDPCAALATHVDLTAHESATVRVILGQAADAAAAQELATRYRDVDADAVLAAIQTQWQAVCDTVQVATPDQRIDTMVNHWLPYQVLSCRVWARTAYYQASGAWGFRDQLQDVMALCLSRPDVARAHILRSAARQFAGGDVQHWWLPPTGAGVRTRIVDDRVWLPFVTAHYIRTTGDAAILDEQLPFLDAPALTEDQVDSFTTPPATHDTASLAEHCARAIEVSFGNGARGLPLFGRGDWNDGMNLVGKDGKGESVWMAWFLIAAIDAFLSCAASRIDPARTKRWREHATQLAAAAESHAWDGAWWTRGWYDNGHPLGVSADKECRIDTIAQSWSVLSGAANRERAAQAMASVDKLAVRRDAQLIALFTPAFDTTAEDPGYIKGYPPGLRENGGQYTHGVIWSACAFAELGDGDKAGELLTMLNPIHHADSASKLAIYQVEPYVSCADLYTARGLVGRGGWTWYSGSAGWLYRAILEWQLGLRIEGDNLKLVPCIPHDWPRYDVTLRHGEARYAIRVENPQHVCRGLASLTLDGVAQDPSAARIPLATTGEHAVHAVLG